MECFALQDAFTMKEVFEDCSKVILQRSHECFRTPQLNLWHMIKYTTG
jgi:hypothetical protein